MQESVSGFEVRGTWGDVVEHGERITRALRDADVDGEAFDEWNEWRPKSHERLGEDVSEKTAAQASVSEGKGERAGKAPDEDLQTAGEMLSDSYDHVEAGESDSAVERWSDSLEYVARAADSAGRRALRRVEDTVYQRVMTQIAPYYFDNTLISANIQKTTREEADVAFIFEVNINDDELKTAVSDRLSDFDDEVTRWHVDTKKQTETAEAAEGVEPPTPTANPPKSTNN
ncbi:DUF5828 family protein [Haloquadratum walsbyi]|jgi:hypothetical protein|uniref:Uncharacterized protein n=1 Tax=Haloquadratum walsbyi J07HQW2 TaxID=1238425 RepID=U1PQE0_9EURY|nr:DUF5828 family protein [Haloquadratum walsbyi]ERG95972.1 MAG: hypothetical protein J07HQW2_02433 [Haloquadratum walsbyi J07HQW2]